MTMTPVKVGKPTNFDAWVWVAPGNEYVRKLRGQLFFDGLAQSGLRVTVLEQGSDGFAIPINRPWTNLFMEVPMNDMAENLGGLAELTCAVVMDVHFPIMKREEITTQGTGTSVAELWAARDVMLANLRLADAVTVSQPDWAADLAEINPNVFYLPDLVLPDWMYLGEGNEPEGLTVSEWRSAMEALQTFAVRINEVNRSAAQHKSAVSRGLRSSLALGDGPVAEPATFYEVLDDLPDNGVIRDGVGQVWCAMKMPKHGEIWLCPFSDEYAVPIRRDGYVRRAEDVPPQPWAYLGVTSKGGG